LNIYERNKLVKIESYQRTKFGTVHKYAVIEYNESDSVSRKIVFSHEGDTMEIISKSYNENKLVTETNKDFEYKVLTRKEFSYAPNTQTTKEFRIEMGSQDTLEVREIKVIFDKHGNILRSEAWGPYASEMLIDDKEVSVSEEEIRNGRKGYLQVSDFDYTYDKFNNWTQFDYFYNGKARKKNKITTARRIEYY
jgi:hypothetical protein